MSKNPEQTEKPVLKKRKKIAVEPAAVAPYEIPGLPISEGPISSQRKLMPAKGDQSVIVVIQPGAFQYVWEMLEAKARVDHQKYSSITSITVAAEEAVRAFREANREAIARPGRRANHRRRIATEQTPTQK